MVRYIAYFFAAVVSNGACISTTRISILVKPYVFVLFADPPIVPNVVDLSATIYLSGAGTDSYSVLCFTTQM